MSTVAQLSKAGADEALMMQYVACVVPNDTKVINVTGNISSAFLSGMGGTADVMVVTGPHAGCKGVVSANQLRVPD